MDPLPRPKGTQYLEKGQATRPEAAARDWEGVRHTDDDRRSAWCLGRRAETQSRQDHGKSYLKSIT